MSFSASSPDGLEPLLCSEALRKLSLPGRRVNCCHRPVCKPLVHLSATSQYSLEHADVIPLQATLMALACCAASERVLLGLLACRSAAPWDLSLLSALALPLPRVSVIDTAMRASYAVEKLS